MNPALSFCIGPYDGDEAMRRVNRHVGGGMDISISCIDDPTRNARSVSSLVRCKLERALMPGTFMDSHPARGSIHIPARPPHLLRPVDASALFEGGQAHALFADFLRRYGGWYALRQLREEDFDVLQTQMTAAMLTGGNTVGPCYEKMLHVTVRMLADALRSGSPQTNVYVPGAHDDASMVYGGNLIRSTLKAGKKLTIQRGRMNVMVQDEMTNEDLAEFDAGLVLNRAGRTRIILFDAMHSNGADSTVADHIERKQVRNNGFLFRDVKSIERSTYGFVTLAAARHDVWTTDQNVVRADHLAPAWMLDLIMTKAMQSRSEDKYLAFRSLVDAE